MTPRIRKAAALASTVAVLGGTGLGVANAATSSSTSTTSSKAARGDRGPGLRAAELATIAKTLGVTTEKLQAAVDAAKPARPTGTKADRGAERAAEIATALGVETAKVQAILDADRPAKPSGTKRERPTGEQPSGDRTVPPAGERPAGGRGPGGPGGPRGGGARADDAKLVAALAKGLGLTEEAVKAGLTKVATAHAADHAAKDAARFAALAKSLGLEAADVQKAFEAARPAKPAKATTAAK